LRALKTDRPEWKVIVSFADDGQGHLGTIYQACGAKYLGSSGGEVVVVFSSGARISGRSMVKQLEGKDMSDAKVEFSQGKHRYVFFLDKNLEAKCVKPFLPYPKREQAVVNE
jgi:hypothetical protein